MDGDAVISVTSSPTEEDYHHARRAHAVWAQIRARGNTRQASFGQIITLLAVFAIAASVLFPSVFHFRPWIVWPPGVLVPVLAYPAAILLLGLWTWLFARHPPAVEQEIVDVVVADDGSARLKRKRTANSWLFQLIFIAIVAPVIFYVICKDRPVASIPEEDIAGARHVASWKLIVGSFACLFLSTAIFARIQRGRLRTRMMLTKFPALLRTRRWEFNEEFLAERGPLLESVMRWEYVQKFLETPRVVLLYPNEDTYYLVAKSAFEDEMQFARFMGLLMRKVQRGIKQPHGATGFAVLPVIGASRGPI